ncbi:MAG: hypothetical protein GY909_06590 [Oligoflexia bacterium]|nr:hypothetical protein [Oligoflexia bacterium]
MSSENLSYKVSHSEFVKELEVPFSKSYGNRVLILASLKKEPVTIEYLPTSTDVETMITCLKQIGIEIIKEDNRLFIKNSFPECEISSDEVITLETGDGGTTNRFLIAMLALGKNKYKIIPKEKMIDRPMDELWRCFDLCQVQNSKEKDHWLVKGPYQYTGKLEVDCSETTQILSGLQMALSLDDNIDVVPKELSASKKYHEMTEQLIKEIKEENTFRVPIDFSSLGYPLALASTLGEVKVTNFRKIDHYQPDSIFISILMNMGANVTMSEEGIHVKKPEDFLRPISMDCSSCPDLVPTLAFVCSYANGVSTLSGLEILKHKESDRVEGILTCLKAFNVPHKYNDETFELIINGPAKKTDPVELTPERDHRMVMMSYMFMRINSGGVLNNSDCVDKSFSNFYQIID